MDAHKNERAYYDALQHIARDYMTPDQLRRCRDAQFLGYTEVLEMAYENIQEDARQAVKGKRRPREARATLGSIAS
jgi:hypothetical protein